VSNLIRTEFPNGVVETRQYDDLNRLLFLENRSGDTVLSSYEYELDNVGHRQSVVEHDGRRVDYQYDDLYRLTEERITDPGDPANDGRVIGYQYDLVGNREVRVDSVEGTTTYEYDDNDRLLSKETTLNGEVVNTVEYSYDDNGNTIAKLENGTEETTYIWNDENRLIGAELPDPSSDFASVYPTPLASGES